MKIHPTIAFYLVGFPLFWLMVYMGGWVRSDSDWLDARIIGFAVTATFLLGRHELRKKPIPLAKPRQPWAVTCSMIGVYSSTAVLVGCTLVRSWVEPQQRIYLAIAAIIWGVSAITRLWIVLQQAHDAATSTKRADAEQ